VQAIRKIEFVPRCAATRGPGKAQELRCRQFVLVLQPGTDCPIGSIHRCAANSIAILLQEGAYAVAFCCRVPFLEEWEPEQGDEIMATANQRLILQYVGLEHSNASKLMLSEFKFGCE
jgi:hypothetical protein